jgi:hypothetical protein
MSNTSTVTPYESTESISLAAGVVGACVAGALVGTVAIAQWLLEETPEDRAIRDRIQTERRRERLSALKSAAAPKLTSVRLHLGDPESLVRAAEKLGYRLDPVMQSAPSLASQPHILLSRPSGERLAIERNPKGRMVVHTLGNARRVQSLIRQHTTDRAVEHLTRAGMRVQTATLANGEVQILAHEQGTRRGGAAEIRAQVRTDGTAWVDIAKVKGGRCETIVADLAQAIGGKVSQTTKKTEYYQLPGEPASVQVKG